MSFIKTVISAIGLLSPPLCNSSNLVSTVSLHLLALSIWKKTAHNGNTQIAPLEQLYDYNPSLINATNTFIGLPDKAQDAS